MDRTLVGRHAVLVLCLCLGFAWPALAGEAELEESSPTGSVETLHGPLFRAFQRPVRQEPLFPGLGQELAGLPTFFADTQLTVRFRTYEFTNNGLDGSHRDAWAMGGSIAYQSGELWDLLSAQLEYHASFPIVAPSGRDGTRLLVPGQKSIAVLTNANARLRLGEHLLVGGRQGVLIPFVNRRDNRMVPQAFEALTLYRDAGELRYGAGYFWRIKQRDDNDFVAMSSAAGATKERGVASLGGHWDRDAFSLGVFNHFGVDMFNTLYAEGAYTWAFGEGRGFKLESQFTHQQSVGEELTGGFDTWTRLERRGRLLGLSSRVLRRSESCTGSRTTLRSGNGLRVGRASTSDTRTD